LATAAYDLESGSGSFDYAITTDRVDELIALLPLDPAASDPWRPELGRGSVEGTLTVSPDGVGTVMRLELEDVSAPGFTADRAVGHLVVEGEGIPDLRIELQRREAAMIVAGAVPFAGPDGAPLGELELSVDAAGWPLADVRVWLPWETSLDGDFSGALEVLGSPLSPTGSVQGHLTPVRWEGFEADKLELSLSFDDRGTRVGEAALGIAGGRITGAGELSNSGELLSATVTSEVLSLEKLPLLNALPGELTGGLALSGDITSAQGKLRLDSVVEWVDVRLAGRPLGVEGSSPMAAAWDGDYLQVEGSLAGLAQVSGGGRLDAVGAELDFQVESKRLGDLLGAIGGDSVSEIEGELSGHLLAAGKTGSRPELEVRLEADHVALRRGDRSLQNLEPVVLRFEREGLVVVSLYLGEGETSSEAFVSGRIAADESRAIDLRIQASLASDWFQAWLAGADLRGGTFDVLGEITGTLAAPRLNGVGEVREARLLVEGLPTTVDELEGVVLFYPDQIVLDSALARVAGGSVRASGSARLGDEAGDFSYQIHFSGEKLSFRYPEGWLIRGDAEVTLSSTEEGRQLGGIARLDRAFYVQDVLVGLEQLLQLLFERRRIEVGEVEEWQTGTQLNLAVEVTEGLRVRNNLADLQGSAELVLRGNLARPVVFGTVELNPGGRLDYGGNKFSLEQGLINFTNPHRVEPILDLVATADLREYDVTLNLSGTLDRLTVDFTSDPPLAELEVLALLSGGRDPNDLSPKTPETAEENVGAEGFLASQATFLIASRFNRLFGLDQFRIDPLTSGTGNLSSARVSVGKQLSRDLFATYSYDPSETEEQIIELEWSLSRSLILVLTQNGDGTYAVDARWEKAL
jgi:translocation and assembly module TamB